MPTPKPAQGGFFTDRSPPIASKADKDFIAFHKRRPNAIEAQLAPREGHPLEQTVVWEDCPLAKAYPQWEVTLYESVKNRVRMLPNMLKGPRLGPDGPSVGEVNAHFGSREKKCDEL